MIKFLNLIGNDYEIGLQLGVHFRESINKRIDKYESMLKNEELYEKFNKIRRKIKAEYPDCLDEIYGRADGAKVRRAAMLLMFLPELYNKKTGCTTAIYRKIGEVGFAHNEDDKGYSEEDVAIVRYNYGNEWVVGYVLCDRLLGTTVGYNSSGIVHSSNYIFPDVQDENSISRYVISKKLVRMTSIKEIEKFLKNIKVSSPFSFNVFDLINNKCVNFEVDIDKTYKKVISENFLRSNHFIIKKSKLLSASDNTKYRYKRGNEMMNSLDKNNACLDYLFKILSDKTDNLTNSIFIKGETIFTFGIDSKNKRVNMINHFSNEKINLRYNEFRSN